MAIHILTRVFPSGDFTIYPEPRVAPKNAPDPLGLSLPANSHNEESHGRKEPEVGAIESLKLGKSKLEKAPRGSRGLSKYGAKMIRSCCQLIEEKAAGRAVAMLTLTLPSMSRERLNKANEKWSEIMRQFAQELRRQLRRVGLPLDYVYAVEWQKRGALHSHLLFIGSQHKKITSANQYLISKSWFRETWQRILKNVLGEEFDCKAATRVERVKTSCGAYMSKYLSKGERPQRRDGENLFTGIADMSIDRAMQICNADMDNHTYKLMQTSLMEWIVATEDNRIADADMHFATVQTYVSALEQRRHEEEKSTQTSHPSAYWGADLSLRRRVLARVETWSRKIKTRAYFKVACEQDMWLEQAEKIVERYDTYWSKLVKPNDFPRAISGRLRLKDNWKEEAMTKFFGRDISNRAIITNEQYGKWRIKRDGYDPLCDVAARAEWIFNHYRASVSYGI